MAKSARSGSTDSGQAHWIEWLTGSLSAICVISLIGWVGFEAMTQNEAPPVLSVSIVSSEARPGGYIVIFEVENAADRTAADVVVRGEITNGSSVVETVEVTLDYVPMHSRTRGGLIFRNDPEGRSRISATGFSEP
ncbi:MULTISPECIES: hypothetical protein [unclassified Ensifer]|uniref:hypothetical protein n=1 Tax=unclassified Ensifer TaxID=2633371 RepID=UPI0008131EB8|nr:MULTISPECIES: hypothetical protein [unclassified Ensifer]OCP06333.1 hypothetical protein BBX50_23445 [Ensifer sp. LC11]OCP09093.1 hypothetical protein BC374_20310 [Ensifer sp. LC13]OCP09876.1 hypothetical protein BC362_09085 [Ensifer sp. LC14]OCP31591.1 hypothetical protein BC364_23295 [Ensifer sp. LC499]